jgi:hypothetical protein
MKEKFTDSSIDQTFKEAVDPMEIQPSEKFWTEASDSILERANQSYTRKVRIWKTTSLMLAVMLASLVFYTFYAGNKINSIQQQITSLEKQQVSGDNKEKTNEPLIVSDNKNTTANNLLNTNAISLVQPNSSAQFNSQNSSAKSSNDLSTKLSENEAAQLNVNTLSAVNKENNAIENVAPSFSVNENNVNSQPVSSLGSVADNQTLSTSFPDLQEISSAQPRSDFSLVAANSLEKNTIAFSMRKPSNAVSNVSYKPSRFSIGVFVAPAMSGVFNNGQNGSIYSNSAENGEKATMAFNAGVNVDYAISRKWTIESGIGYHTYSFCMQPTVIWAEKNSQGQLGYSVITSCGILHLPYHDSQIQSGDNIHMNGNAYCGYLSIPLQIKYQLMQKRRLGIYFTGGINSNFTIVERAFIHWTNNADEDDESIHNIDGVSNMQFLYTFGSGLNYLIGRGFSIYAEPFMEGSATPIDKNVPIISSPYYLGMRTGLSYNF